MNRRNFLNNLLTATAGFTILPGAGRLWVARRESAVDKWCREQREKSTPSVLRCHMPDGNVLNLAMLKVWLEGGAGRQALYSVTPNPTQSPSP